ncbi:MAG: hypothetical protein RR831_06710 [Stenotrophomonas sp.]|uniref:hypothetical protein n=1 Tax=Stenotrophomonas sp. NA06056 TaxID=2742129 RepID=UPI00158DF9AF|nr:hypothetical protein [Stenotrophomonas sp. NA06056]QKW57660.1 hypothetical protein HUT07_14025 [Stenotrophomonas sp. NA06056]
MRSDDRGIAAMQPGDSWPGGGYIELAVMRVDDVFLTRRLGQSLLRGSEPGMGAWRSMGIRLPSGAVAELIAHDAEPDAGFTVRIDSQSDPRIALQEILHGLGLGAEQIIWSSIDINWMQCAAK